MVWLGSVFNSEGLKALQQKQPAEFIANFLIPHFFNTVNIGGRKYLKGFENPNVSFCH